MTKAECLMRYYMTRQIATQNGFEINKEKSHGLQEKVKFCGYIYYNHKVIPNMSDKTVTNWPEPRNQTELRRFLEVTIMAQQHVKDYAKIAIRFIKSVHKRV